MALGLAPRARLMRSAAAGVGNALVLLGARTGRDGIGGASVLASAELDDGALEKRPSVQVGDPFEEKKLLECSLELLDAGLLVSLQDLGAAGLTSAAAEMASKGGVGVDIDVARVPLREPGMEPFEIMVSESQERMLCVVEPETIGAVMAVCAKWEVGGSVIGAVTASGQIRVVSGEETVGEMPVRALVDECPLYDLHPARPTEPLYAPPPAALARDCSPAEALIALLASANLASRQPLFEQYDALVQSRTVRRPGEADAAVLTIAADLPEGEDPLPALAVSIDCNGRRVAADPYWGTVEAVLECAANLACTGAEVLGATNNLNFGNPTKPHIAWQLTESVRGLGDACRALRAPIVGGNVSLYNEGPTGPIYPTPVIGMLGRLPDARRAAGIAFAQEGHAVALAGSFAPRLAASELHKLQGRALPDVLAPVDLDSARETHEHLREAVRAGVLASAHDIAEGGLAVALAECCIGSGLGARIKLMRAADLETLFGEGPGGFVVSGAADDLSRLGERMPLEVMGAVGGEVLSIRGTRRPATRRGHRRSSSRFRSSAKPTRRSPRSFRDGESRCVRGDGRGRSRGLAHRGPGLLA